MLKYWILIGLTLWYIGPITHGNSKVPGCVSHSRDQSAQYASGYFHFLTGSGTTLWSVVQLPTFRGVYKDVTGALVCVFVCKSLC